MIENLKSLGEMLAAKLIGQDPETGQIPQPKAHEAIDGEIGKWEESTSISESIKNMPPEHQGILDNILEGIATGGMGGTLKLVQNQLPFLLKGLQGPLTRREMYGLKTLQNPEMPFDLKNLTRDLIKTGNFEKISKHWKHFPPNKPGHRWFNKPK